jgi:hypothetical protein
LPPTHFVNASWARLFLPVRVGSEVQALRWIYQISSSGANAVLNAHIKDIVVQLRDYRRQTFGSETEIVVTPTDGPCPSVSQHSLCMGSWEETLPTDGTHIEVLQSTTLAADDDSQQRMEDAADLRAEEIERQKRDNELRSTVNSAGPTTVNADIEIKLTDKSNEPKP